jgi:hypothetical protein
MSKAYTIEGGTIVFQRKLTELDQFVKDFLSILTNHSDYLIVSGFVTIATGRTRATEDVDILVPVMDKKEFTNLFEALQKNNFWCYQGDTAEEVFPYIEKMTSIRFARQEEMFPNMEFIPINETKKAKYFEFKNPQKMRIGNFSFKIPMLEFEILYKEQVLAGKKDIDDAKHLRAVFEDILKEENFKKVESIIAHEIP